MATFPHLPLERLDRSEDRRRRPAPIAPPHRASAAAHGGTIRAKVDAAAAQQTALPRIEGIDPELILKVTLAAPIQEEAWRAAGFKVLSQEPGNIIVLFSDNTEMQRFRERLAQYQQDPPRGQKHPAYNALFASIDDIGSLTPTDRIGPRLRAEGVSTPEHIDVQATYMVDLELWDAPTQLDRLVRVERIITHIEGAGAEIDSRYVGTAGLIILRARVSGALLRDLLALPAVSRIDIRPIPDLGERDPPLVTIQNAPAITPPAANAPLIGVIDSGSVDHPLLVPSLVESLGVPEALGGADIWGHGTKVAGIACFGDVRNCVDQNSFESPVRIISVKVVNDDGQFDNETTIPEQMHTAIRALHQRGCRIINISLGDKHRIPYDGGRVSAWAATLDALASELDIVIVISAGNSADGSRAPWGEPSERITQTYPTYLTAAANRIVEPATAAIALTVGSLAHANGLPVDLDPGAEVRSIATANTPTPITRCGPGVNDAIKPDLVDYGGTCLYDGFAQRIATGHHYASAGMLTLRADYRPGLLTSSTGTSMASPRVAFKAAALLRAYPQASANMIRTLLALSAEYPAETVNCLEPVGPTATRLCLGYGVPNTFRAINSVERRVVFVADRQEIAIDQFALFRVPLPQNFRTTRGVRHIRVSMAFNPPVRYTRLEYLGLRLNYHLLRGISPDEIFEHFRSRQANEAAFERLPGTAKCQLVPTRDVRGTSTLQKSCFTMKRNVDHYGEDYYLVVFAERRWAGEEITHQQFAIAVELEHEQEIDIYQPVRVRVHVRA